MKTDWSPYLAKKLLEPNQSPLTREDDSCREQALFQDHAVIVDEAMVIASTLWNGQDAVLTKLGHFELYRQESVGRRAFSVTLLKGTSAFDSRILHQKVQSARKEEC